MWYNYFSVYLTSGIPASPGFLRYRQHMRVRLHMRTDYVSFRNNIAFCIQCNKWIMEVRVLGTEENGAKRAGFVVLHKSLFDAIPILPDLPRNFYRIFMLKQHPSTFVLDKVYGTIFHKQFWFILYTYRAVCWILTSRLCLSVISLTLVDSHISYMYILPLSLVYIKLLIGFTVQGHFRRFVIRDKILDRNLFIILCDAYCICNIWMYFDMYFIYVRILFLQICFPYYTARKIINRILFRILSRNIDRLKQKS